MLDMGSLTGMPQPEAVSETRHIPMADIGPDPDQPRRVFERSKIAILTAQFIDPAIGQLEAITIRHNPSGLPKFLIVSGENRYRAAVDAEWETIKADVVESSSFIHQVLSNETRTDMSAFDKCRAYHSLVNDYGYTPGGVAALLGRHGSYVSDHMGLSDLPEIVITAAKDGKANSIAVLTALRILVTSHTSPSQKEAIQEFIDNAGEDGITKQAVTEFAKTLKSRKKSKAEIPAIEGKPFKVVSVQDDILTIKQNGAKNVIQYRITRIAAPS